MIFKKKKKKVQEVDDGYITITIMYHSRDSAMKISNILNGLYERGIEYSDWIKHDGINSWCIKVQRGDVKTLNELHHKEIGYDIYYGNEMEQIELNLRFDKIKKIINKIND